MFTHGFVRRAALAAFGASAIVTAVAGQTALAASGLTFSDIRVDVLPLRATAGDPTAAWVQQDLSARLAQALAGRMARNGATLTVRIDYLTLSSGAVVDCGSSLDNISGVAIIGGVQTPVRATTRYQASPVDQTTIEQTNRDRVSQLVQALLFWLSRDL